MRTKIETSEPVRQFNALVALFDEQTAGLLDRAEPGQIYRTMMRLPDLGKAASLFRSCARKMGYAV
jgi:hypothetical protein